MTNEPSIRQQLIELCARPHMREGFTGSDWVYPNEPFVKVKDVLKILAADTELKYWQEVDN